MERRLKPPAPPSLPPQWDGRWMPIEQRTTPDAYAYSWLRGGVIGMLFTRRKRRKYQQQLERTRYALPPPPPQS